MLLVGFSLAVLYITSCIFSEKNIKVPQQLKKEILLVTRNLKCQQTLFSITIIQSSTGHYHKMIKLT